MSDYDVSFAGEKLSAVEAGLLPPMTRFSVSMWVKNLNPTRTAAIFSLGSDDMPGWLTVANPNGLYVEINGKRRSPETAWERLQELVAGGPGQMYPA